MRIGLVGVARMEAFHGATLQGLDGVEQVVVTEASPARAQAVVKGFDLEVAPNVETLLAAGLDGVAISAASAHTELIGRAQDAGLTTFCQKPAASDLAGSLRITERVADGLVPVHIGFRPCFVAGLRAARDAVTSGSLGWIHTMRASTNDAAPPHASYIPTSGGFIRDISIHDFEAVRFVTDCEVIIVCAVGQNRDEAFFAEPDDIDAAASVLTMDDATIALISGSRFNGQPGLRLRRNGRPTALRSVEAGMDFPAAMAYTGFMERFHQGCVDELVAFNDLVAGRIQTSCSARQALRAFLVAQACELRGARAVPRGWRRSAGGGDRGPAGWDRVLNCQADRPRGRTARRRRAGTQQ